MNILCIMMDGYFVIAFFDEYSVYNDDPLLTYNNKNMFKY